MGDGGVLPRCIGPECSTYETCEKNLVENLIECHSMKLSKDLGPMYRMAKKLSSGANYRIEKKKKKTSTTPHQAPGAIVAATGLNPLDYS